MSARRGNLKAAHSGYRYQDIATAYELVRAVVERYDEVIVDRKQVDDDRIDDLEVRAFGRRVRRQFKSSLNSARVLSEVDFTGDNSLRIDRLVLTYVKAGASQADEYRLCATWAPPLPTDPLFNLLTPTNVSPTLPGSSAAFFTLKGDEIWPQGHNPIWIPLAAYIAAGAEFGRAEFLAFCKRFVIELKLPLASTSLTAPGPFEEALTELLEKGVGIGRYPNHGRSPADVAALAIALATLARTQEASITPRDVERELEIRTDYGRVAQAFPLDEALFHDRPSFRQSLRETALAGRHQLVLGPPGAGKSWDLTRLAEELKADGAIVARHYCYLEPGDTLVERRVTSDVFFGNVIAEIYDAEPNLQGSRGARYAAGIEELEGVMADAVNYGRPVVLIVDGIDHIARVRADARSLSEDETDIVERLATLHIPPGASVIVGSQPGRHLEPLRSRWGDVLAVRTVPAWAPDDIAALARRHDVDGALRAAGISDESEITRVLDVLAERADGNPLYARYLSRGISTGLSLGHIANPYDWIASSPTIAGDVAVYYRHLYRAASAEAQAIADLLSVIDFAVTEQELAEMIPAFVGAWVPRALERLMPVLSAASGQGGVRIFHESFRRFMTSELAEQGRSIADALAPVIRWLEGRGFFIDAKAYRFLLPALRRAGRESEVLARVGTTFVSDSVAQAHPLDAVSRNLALAADVAAHARDWPSLVRCVELHRSAFTCFDDSQNNWRDYWETYVQLFGPAALAERLLFDGRPTLDRSDGLFACSLIDDNGGTAPWREYLALPSGEDSPSYDHFDEQGSTNSTEQDRLVEVHGFLRLGEYWRVIRWLLRNLNQHSDIKFAFLRAIAARLARMSGPALVEKVASRGDASRRGGQRFSSHFSSALRLGLADEYRRLGNQAAAVEAATRALEVVETPGIAVECVIHGAPYDAALGVARELGSIPIAVGPEKSHRDATAMRAWVASVRLKASDRLRGAAEVDAEYRRIEGPGWYRCWLRYVLGLARVEVARREGGDVSASVAFQELTRDAHPFTGEPRACDLYAIRRVIYESIVWGLSLLRSQEEWRTCLDALLTAARETASRIDQEDGGPISTGALLDALLPYVGNSEGGELVSDAVELLIEHLETRGTYYPTHADYEMRLARTRQARGKIELAREAWDRGAVFLCGYGWRKDITIFDLIGGVQALNKVSPDAAIRALADIQPLTDAVVVHTDGRSTNRAPNNWLREVLKVKPAVGIAIIATTLVEEEGGESWVNYQAIRDAVKQVRDSADPSLVDALLATLRFNVEYENEAEEASNDRIAPVIRLAGIDRVLARHRLRRVAAEVVGDGRHYVEKAAERVEVVAASLALAVPHIAKTKVQETKGGFDKFFHRQQRELRLQPSRVPLFPRDASFVDIMAGLRTVRTFSDEGDWDYAVLALGYYVGDLVDAGREDDARRLLRFFARDTDVGMSGREHPLGKLAVALESAGYTKLAATAYALAFTATRGGGGWLRLGDESHSYLVTHAVNADRATAAQVIADEIAYSLRGSWYGAGTSQHVIEQLTNLGETDVIEQAWHEAFSVIAHRLPLVPDYSWFARLDSVSEVSWTINEALAALQLARLKNSQLTRKIVALSGIVGSMKRSQEIMCAPLQWWLTRNTHVTSVLLVLNAMLVVERKPYPITQSIEDVLKGYAASDLWGIAQLSTSLMERAGIPLSSSRVYQELVPKSGEASNKDLRYLKAVDSGRVLKELSELWPELPSRIAERMRGLFEIAANKSRADRSYREAFGRSGGRVHPPAPILHWPEELFQVALNESLFGLTTHLWKRGLWEPAVVDYLLNSVLPDTQVHLGLEESRAPRPGWILPSAAEEGLGTLPVVGDDDPEYSGWTRLATIEVEYVEDQKNSYGPPVESVTLLAGAVVTRPNISIPPGTVPFTNADVDGWWPHAKPFELKIGASMPLGPVIQLTRVTDWLGDSFLLIPPVEFYMYLGLIKPEFGAPLLWVDSEGRPGIVLRTWRVLNAKALDVESVALEGADLIIRPDLCTRITGLYPFGFQELRTVWKEKVQL